MIKARTPIELLAKVYEDRGWTRKVGESRTKRVCEEYNITIKGDWFVAERKGENHG